MERSFKALSEFRYGIAAIIGLLVLWEGIGRSGLVSRIVVPVPSGIIQEAGIGLATSGFFWNWGYTLSVWLVALACGMAAGLMVGFLAGSNLRVYGAVSPLLGYLRAIPPIVMFPVALIACTCLAPS